jgi:hypothetical protein
LDEKICQHFENVERKNVGPHVERQIVLSILKNVEPKNSYQHSENIQ